MGRELLKAESTAVFHTGTVPAGAVGRPAGTPVDVTGPGSLTVGVFRRGADEQLALVTNTNYRGPVTTEVIFFSGDDVPRIFQAADEWRRVAGVKVPGGYRVKLSLSPGGAVLLKW